MWPGVLQVNMANNRYINWISLLSPLYSTNIINNFNFLIPINWVALFMCNSNILVMVIIELIKLKVEVFVNFESLPASVQQGVIKRIIMITVLDLERNTLQYWRLERSGPGQH